MQDNAPVIGPVRFYRKAFWQFPIRMSLMFFLEIAQATMLVLMPYAVRGIVQAAEAFDPARGVLWDALRGPFWELVWITLALTIFSRCSGMLLLTVAPYIRVKPRLWLFEHLLGHSLEYFSNRHSGALGAKIHDVLQGMAMATWTLLFQFLSLFILFAASVVTIGMVYWPLGAIVVVWGIVYTVMISALTMPRIRWIERISKARARITGLVIDVAANIMSLKAFARGDYEKERLRESMKDEIYSNIRFNLWGEAIHWSHFTLSFILVVGSIFYCIQSYEGGHIDLPTISFVFTLLFVLSNNARNLTWSLQAFMEYVGQIRDGVNTIMVPHNIEDSQDAGHLKVRKGAIRYKNVSFAYEQLKQKIVLKDLDIEIEDGQKVGVVGPSGAGKSTLVNLLLRYYELDVGAILIDGQDIATCSQDSLRAQIALIPQDTALFHRSLADNIRYGRLEATDEDVIRAAQYAHADEFIRNLPEGYDTLVGERGVKLSGGQRQRIAIARAILKDAPILVLDEATSALDSESERLIQESLLRLMEGKTVIAIAHRLSTIAHLDRLLIMEEGRIVEDGSHDELLAKNGYYARLWAMQSGNFIGKSL